MPEFVSHTTPVATEVAVLRSITKDSLQEFFEDKVLNVKRYVSAPTITVLLPVTSQSITVFDDRCSRRLLTMQVEGHNKNSETGSVGLTEHREEIAMDGCAHFRSRMPLYPNVYSHD